MHCPSQTASSTPSRSNSRLNTPRQSISSVAGLCAASTPTRPNWKRPNKTNTVRDAKSLHFYQQRVERENSVKEMVYRLKIRRSRRPAAVAGNFLDNQGSRRSPATNGGKISDRHCASTMLQAFAPVYKALVSAENSSVEDRHSIEVMAVNSTAKGRRGTALA